MPRSFSCLFISVVCSGSMSDAQCSSIVLPAASTVVSSVSSVVNSDSCDSAPSDLVAASWLNSLSKRAQVGKKDPTVSRGRRWACYRWCRWPLCFVGRYQHRSRRRCGRSWFCSVSRLWVAGPQGLGRFSPLAGAVASPAEAAPAHGPPAVPALAPVAAPA